MTSKGAPTILLTGGTGQIGSELLPLLSKLGVCVAPPSSELDLATPESIREFVRRTKPTVIVNAGAYTAVDRAESERDKAFSVNAGGPAVLAEEASRLGSLLVHYSTDYVFDGTKGSPYVETDLPAPLSVYGASKAEGEQAVTSGAGPHLVLRTSWVYGPRGTNFPRTILRLARERTELRVVNDQVGAPTSAIFLASATAELVRLWVVDRDTTASVWSGIYHLSAAGATTWYEFARAVLEGDPHRSEQTLRSVVPISAAEYPTVAQRPLYSVLDCGKIERRFLVHPSNWMDQFTEVMARRPS